MAAKSQPTPAPSLPASPAAEADTLPLGAPSWAGFDFYHPQLITARRVISAWYLDFWGMDEGGHIIISGGCGCGKTHLARCIELLYRDGGALFISEPELFAAVLGNKSSAIHRLRNAFPLIIDDVGTAHITKDKWVGEIYWQVLNDNSHPLMMTTNFDLAGLCDWIGERATSRLLDGFRFDRNLHYVDLAAVPDYRLTKAKRAA